MMNDEPQASLPPEDELRYAPTGEALILTPQTPLHEDGEGTAEHDTASPLQSSGEELGLRTAPLPDGDIVDVVAALAAQSDPAAPLFAPPAWNEAPSEVSPDAQIDHDLSLDFDLRATQDFDIVGALAAVSSLSDLVAEREAAQQAQIAQQEAAAQARAARQAREDNPDAFFPTPPLFKLKRGSLASLLSGVGLIGLGAWLTFTSTTGNPPSPILTSAALAGMVALALFGRWLSGGRWTSGALFGALALLLGGGTALAVLQLDGGLAAGWSFILIALGVAFVLTGFLSQPRSSRPLLPGLGLIVAGMVAYAVQNGVVPSVLNQTALTLWPVVAVIVALTGVLPLVLRRRA